MLEIEVELISKSPEFWHCKVKDICCEARVHI